jgi:hypothetical protein
MKDRRNFLRICFVLTAFGFMSLFAMLGRPTLADIRAVDFVHLIGTGMCFGGAIVALAAFYRSPR